MARAGWFVMLGVASAITTLSGCTCTQAGCLPGVSLELHPASAASFAAGTLGIDVATDAASAHFDCTIDAANGGDGCMRGGSPTLQASPVTNAAGVTAIHVSIYAAPRTVTVRVTRAGSSVVAQLIVPTYHEYYPNGPDCDDTPCRSATADLDVP